MTDWLTPEQRKKNMAAIRSSGTSPEARLGRALGELFPRHRVVMHDAELPGRPDFYLPGLRLAIFADGCFWHGCPEHGRIPDDNRAYWAPKLLRNVQRDKEASRTLRRKGIRVMRIWEHELRTKTIDAAVHRISRAARRPRLGIQPGPAARTDRGARSGCTVAAK
jgi:DNA mismatch endonuclease (patch repair protein)